MVRDDTGTGCRTKRTTRGGSERARSGRCAHGGRYETVVQGMELPHVGPVREAEVRNPLTVTSHNGGKGAGMGDKGGKKDKEKSKQQQVKKQKQKDQRKQEKNRPRTP